MPLELAPMKSEEGEPYVLPESVTNDPPFNVAALSPARYAPADLNSAFALVKLNVRKDALPINQPSDTELAPLSILSVDVIDTTCSALATAVVRDDVIP